VRADELHMRQLVLNLVGNALKFSKPGVPPIVRITTGIESSGPGGEQWWMDIADNGIGFDQEYADRVFQPFQRLHGRGEYEGTGMGLAVCRRIADRYGWSLTVKSTPGEGTTFTMIFPAHIGRTSRTTRSRSPVAAGATA
jgi:signal transduction histidine kinase